MTPPHKIGSVPSGPLSGLSDLVKHRQEAFLQLLLALSEDKAFNRILCCPRFPVRTVTKDLTRRLQLFHESTSFDPYNVPQVLALLYNSVVRNEHKKLYGQYFTSPAVAREAVRFLNPRRGDGILDPGCGTGIFPVTILKHLIGKSEDSSRLAYLGVENDSSMALSTALSLDLVDAPNDWKVLYSDYLCVTQHSLRDIGFKATAIISNPPFVRSDRLGERETLMKDLDLSGRSGLHSFFLAYSEKLLKGGRMVFVLPSEMNHTKYGKSLFQRLNHAFKIKSKDIYCRDNHRWIIADTMTSIPEEDNTSTKLVATIAIFESLPLRKETGTTLKGGSSAKMKIAPMASIASVHRGISTGANAFFVITDEKAKGLRIPSSFLRRVFSPKLPRDKLPEVFEPEDWERLREEGRPCWLFYVKSSTFFEKLPNEVRLYIKMGERQGVQLIPTCRNRKPWYSVRLPSMGAPDLIFTYMSRGNPKFVLNMACALNLTNLLGVYVRAPVKSKEVLTELVEMLNAELKEWIINGSAGRRYAGGLVKFEPGDLVNMPISKAIPQKLGINIPDLL